MLPGLVAGFYTYDECHLDLSVLCTFASAILIHAEAEGIDKEVSPDTHIAVHCLVCMNAATHVHASCSLYKRSTSILFYFLVFLLLKLSKQHFSWSLPCG